MMDILDPRHGTVAGYVAERRAGIPRCAPCLQAKMRYEKSRVMRGALKVPAIGYQRRVQALRALGWSLSEIAHAAGWAKGCSFDYARSAETITAATAARIENAYAKLSMTVPNGPKSNRIRLLSASKGWPPPLAWTNIDDPDEHPRGWQYAPAERGELLVDLDHRRAGITEACRILNLRRDSLEKWCQRNGLGDLIIRMADRERPTREAS